MGYFYGGVLGELVAVLVVLLGVVYFYFQHVFTYFDVRGIPTEKPCFPFGNMQKVITAKEPLGFLVQRLYNRFKAVGPMCGFFMFNRPVLVLTDPDYIKTMLVQDFSNFHDRGLYSNERDDPLTGHLFTIGGQKWRNLRVKLTPTFTSGKLKMMFPTLLQRGEDLKTYLSQHEKEPIEIKDILARFSTDIIGTCAFGIDCNSLQEPDNAFRRVGMKIFKLTKFQFLKQILAVSQPDMARALRIRFIPKAITTFFLGMVKDTVAYREDNGVTRPDFMQLLIELKNKGKLDDDEEVDHGKNKSHEILKPLTLNEVAAQAFVFFIAGFETSSTTMSFCLYEMATNLELQAKVRENIEKVLTKYEGQITYESLLEMDYLDRTIMETLRKYPTVPMLLRSCNKEYAFPGSTMTIAKGTQVFVPVRGLHHDPEYFPDPDKFDPERFTEENKASRPSFTYLPFGEGPRNCIGMRFGMMQTRIGMALMLKHYKITVNERTIEPLTIEPKTFISIPEHGIWLNIEPIQ